MFNDDASVVQGASTISNGLSQPPDNSVALDNNEELIPASFPQTDNQPMYTPATSPTDPVTSSGPYDDSSPTPAPEPAATNNVGEDDLLDIKQGALSKLTPLIGQLEQSPEDKFKTTMMMIQASDDKSLLRSAYETALQIPDDKFRAQALLDVVNEINYFTHPTEQ